MLNSNFEELNLCKNKSSQKIDLNSKIVHAKNENLKINEFNSINNPMISNDSNQYFKTN